ncbi:ABC transporter ATP-binding protein [Pyrococcus furiosus DSM 3638]|uniref:Daunorubicin resistance ATP-binding protein n=3 Tax=Pyrococcus furiosus TaxID=2261 RepID=Q8U2U7_PYRFU|nr:ABC transporter ATP-binding protein [Pyrococcus furiosus]AAL80856.1 daunorubicin resistance ATP-binding protein [Pyrococcus furiosus DSM 3638]AFN03520.1 daunorubicin resistance ATP-binding protein [Pyrococcus furiosus COM1]QEK78417.1 ABC transporter ATP-binding protein [Pyrococcus furiosus DSM 3638]
MVELENVRKSINRKEVLRGISLTVKPGEVHAYLGHNGAGKTTAFRPILGLRYLPEYDLLYPSLSVWDNLKRYASLKGVYDEKELRELLEFFELLECARKKVSALSSGTQRRVAMARAFLGSPEVLILDEPTRELDPEWRLKFKRFLERYVKERNTAVLFSTHILSDVDELCEKITVIKEGRVLFSGSLKEFKRGFPTGASISLKVENIKMVAEVLEDNGYYPNHERVHPAGKCRAVGNQHAPREREYNR